MSSALQKEKSYVSQYERQMKLFELKGEKESIPSNNLLSRISDIDLICNIHL